MWAASSGTPLFTVFLLSVVVMLPSSCLSCLVLRLCVLHNGDADILCVLCAVQTLTPVQNARFMVTSFPYFPDTVGCAVWIAAMDQDEEALRRLRMHNLF